MGSIDWEIGLSVRFMRVGKSGWKGRVGSCRDLLAFSGRWHELTCFFGGEKKSLADAIHVVPECSSMRCQLS